MDRLHKEGAALVYRCAKQNGEPGSDKRGAKVDELYPTPRELINCIAALGPPKRSPAHYLWAVLIARIYEVFPPLWEGCGDAQMDEGVHIEPDWNLAEQPAPILMSISASIGDCFLRRFFVT